MNTLKAIFLLAVPTITAVVLLPRSHYAEERTDQSVEAPDQVAFIKMIDGDLGYQRGDDDKGEWNPAAVNSPLMPGDSLYTPETSKAELQVGDDSFLRLADLAYVGILQNSNDIFQVKLTSGVATLRVQELDRTYEIDSPAMAFTPQKPGEYRFGVKENGETSVTVQEGEGVASVSEGNNQTLEAGRQLTVPGAAAEGGTPEPAGPAPAVVSAPADVKSDAVEQWNEARDKVELNSTSSSNVPPGVTGADALDTTGHWLTTPAYGNVWVPNGVVAGWQPYQAGRWVWVDPYGWSWVSYESWGWAPYHYGRWAFVDGIWVWLPGAGRQVYSPGLVAFVGGGEEFGWFPLGPNEPYVAVFGVGFCCRPYREYHNYRYVTVINRTEIVNAHYSYTRVDNHFYERAATTRGLEIRPTRDTLYARRDAHGVLDARGRVAAQPIRPAHFTPPAKIANSNRPVRAIHDAPAVKSFSSKVAAMPKSGPPRGVNPVDTSRKAVAATMSRPPGLQVGQPKRANVAPAGGNNSTKAGVQNQPSPNGPKKFSVPSAASSAKPGANGVSRQPAGPPGTQNKSYAPPSTLSKPTPSGPETAKPGGAYKPPTAASAPGRTATTPAGGGQASGYHPPATSTGGRTVSPSAGSAQTPGYHPPTASSQSPRPAQSGQSQQGAQQNRQAGTQPNRAQQQQPAARAQQPYPSAGAAQGPRQFPNGGRPAAPAQQARPQPPPKAVPPAKAKPSR